MIINTNITAQISAHNLEASQAMLSKSLSRLSSGSKITSPADDAAGIAVSSRLDAQIRRIDAARNNVGNAISFTQTQDGYLKKIAGALNRMSELSMLAQDVTKSDADRSLYQNEFSQLSAFIQSPATKDFNGVSLFSANNLDVVLDLKKKNLFLFSSQENSAGFIIQVWVKSKIGILMTIVLYWIRTGYGIFLALPMKNPLIQWMKIILLMLLPLNLLISHGKKKNLP